MLPATPFHKGQFILAMLVTACVPACIAALLIDGVHPAFVTLARAGLSAAVLLILSILTMQNPLRIHPRDWPKLALAGVFLAASWYCHIRAISSARVASAEGVFAFYPLLSILLSFFFGRTFPFHIVYIFLLFIALIGLVLCLPNFNVSDRSNIGVLYALAAVVFLIFSGLATVSVYKLYPFERTANAIMLVQYIFSTLAFLPGLMFMPHAMTMPIAGKLIALGVVIFSLSRLLLASSAHRMPPGFSMLLFGIEPIAAITLAWILLSSAAVFPDGAISPRILSGVAIVTVVSLAAQTVQRVGPSAIFRPMRWN